MTDRADHRGILGLGRHAHQRCSQPPGGLVRPLPQREQLLDAGAHGLGKRLLVKPRGIRLPSCIRRRPDAPLLLEQCAQAGLGPFPILDGLRIGPRELPPLVIRPARNEDALQPPLLELLRELAGIEAVGLHAEPWRPLHRAGRHDDDRHAALPKRPRDLVAEPARFVGDVHRAPSILLHRRDEVAQLAGGAETPSLLPGPASIEAPFRAGDIQADKHRLTRLGARDYLPHGSVLLSCCCFAQLGEHGSPCITRTEVRSLSRGRTPQARATS